LATTDMMRKKTNGKKIYFSYPGCKSIDFKPLVIPKKPPIRKDLTQEVRIQQWSLLKGQTRLKSGDAKPPV
jgi:hypothetical protein